MTKLVVLKIDGNFEAGFNVSCEIREKNQSLSMSIKGTLTPYNILIECYQNWLISYRNLTLGSQTRIALKQVSIFSVQDTTISCKKAINNLQNELNQWLNSNSFQHIKDSLLVNLSYSDEIQVLIQTENTDLQKLPWHQWDLFKNYPNAEYALSYSNYKRIKVSSERKKRKKVKVLAVLGNSLDINVQEDRALLENLPDTEITLLEEPNRNIFSQLLWEENWDIFFFAGHSLTENENGRFLLNQNESLTINELQFSLKKAVENGLQLVIFNSCEGLGLAHDLAQLDIPATIVMREPVPDKVAQEFLKYFLKSYSSGKSLYLAVREARERLEVIENKIPGATWLPVIFQNPTHSPPTWSDLLGKNDFDAHSLEKKCCFKPLAKRKLKLSLFVLITTMLFSAFGYIGTKIISDRKPWRVTSNYSTSEIDNSLSSSLTQEINKLEQQKAELRQEEQQIRKQWSQAENLAHKEAEGISGTGKIGKGPVYKEKREQADELGNQLQAKKEEIAEIESKIAEIESKIDAIREKSSTKFATKFVCYSYNGQPTTIAKTKIGDIPLIIWQTDYFSASGWTPQARCQQVSRKFNKFHEQGNLNFLTTGIINNTLVICATNNIENSCTQDNILITLRPSDNPGQVLKQLFLTRDTANSQPLLHSMNMIQRYDSEGRCYYDVESLLNQKRFEERSKHKEDSSFA